MSGRRSSLILTPSWTPGSESDVKLWLKADSGVLNTSGGAAANGEQLGTWTDNSPSALVVKGGGGGSASATNPIYTTNVANGMPGLLFNGSSQFATAASLVVTPGAMCVMLIMQCKNSVGLILEQSASINSNDGFAFYGGQGFSFNFKKGGDPKTASNYNGNFGGQNANALITFNSDRTITPSGSTQTSFSGSTNINYRVANSTQYGTNGTVNNVGSQVTIATGTVTNTLYFMSRAGSSLFTNAYLYEVAIFDSSKDQNFFKQCENYAYNRWGI